MILKVKHRQKIDEKKEKKARKTKKVEGSFCEIVLNCPDLKTLKKC